jgi:uncharacterized membrane protein
MKKTEKNAMNKLKNRPMIIKYIIGPVLLFAISAFSVYHMRVIFMPQWLSQWRGTAVLFCFLAVCYFLFLFFKSAGGKNENKFLTGLILVLGLFWAMATPPNQVPDEPSHFLRSYAISQGDFSFDSGHIYPDDVNSFILHFPAAHNNGHKIRPGDTFYNRFIEYENAINSSEKAPNTSIIVFQILPYLPGALGIFLAKILGLGALGAFYFARMGNVIIFSACSYFAFKLSERFNILLFLLLSLPISCFMWASMSSDSFIFALMALCFSCVLGEEFDAKRQIVFTFSLAVLSMIKISYIIFIILLSVPHKKDWRVKFKKREINRLQAFALTLAVFFIFYFGMGLYVKAFSNYGEIPRTMPNTSISGQLSFVLSNPLRYMAVAWDTLLNNSFFIFSAGLLGWLDANLPIINYLTPILSMAVCINRGFRYKKGDGRKTAIFLISTVLTYAVVMTGLYLTWTPVSLPQIIGLQMRYFIPGFMGLFLAVFYKAGKVLKEGKSNIYLRRGAVYAFDILAGLMMLRVYYIPVINAVATTP